MTTPEESIVFHREEAAVCIEADAKTIEWIRARGTGFFQEANGRQMDKNETWRILVGSERLSAAVPWITFREIRESGKRWRLLADTENRIIGVDVPPGPWRWLYALRMIRHILRWELLRRGAIFLHGHCLSRSGRGLCLIGHSGSGKSTLAYRLFRDGGWAFTTQDDLCILRNKDGSWRVLGWPGSLRLRRSVVAMFPELAATEADLAHPANVIERQFPAEHALLRIFPEELTALFGTGVEPEVVPCVVCWLESRMAATAWNAVLPATFLGFLHESWDVLPERKSGAKVFEVLSGSRTWREFVFNPVLLDAFGPPDFEKSKNAISAFANDIPGFTIGRDAAMEVPFLKAAKLI